MKKYLMMAAVIIAAVMTSCEKKEAANPLDEFVGMGKYVGMKSADIKTDLANNGWKEDTDVEMLFSKQVNGNEAECLITLDENTCISAYGGMTDANYLEDGKYIFGKIGQNYNLTTLGKTAGFTGAMGYKPSGDFEIQTDYNTAQTCIAGNNYEYYFGNWSANDGVNGISMYVGTDYSSTGSFNVTFGVADN